jgi:predicted DCC family thiol-disulfide oxidoreductase YuxK
MATQGLPETAGPQDAELGDTAILLYDGLCGFCDGTVRWLLRHDRGKRIYFAAQQSELAQDILARHGLKAVEHTAYLVVRPGTAAEKIVVRSDAILGSLAMLGGVWKPAAVLLRVFPRGLRNAVYAAVAQNRYRIAGKRAECRIPTPEERSRFLGF